MNWLGNQLIFSLWDTATAQNVGYGSSISMGRPRKCHLPYVCYSNFLGAQLHNYPVFSNINTYNESSCTQEWFFTERFEEYGPRPLEVKGEQAEEKVGLPNSPYSGACSAPGSEVKRAKRACPTNTCRPHVRTRRRLCGAPAPPPRYLESLKNDNPVKTEIHPPHHPSTKTTLCLSLNPHRLFAVNQHSWKSCSGETHNPQDSLGEYLSGVWLFYAFQRRGEKKKNIPAGYLSDRKLLCSMSKG